MRSNNTTTRRTQRSGTSKLPTVLKYPTLLGPEVLESLKNRLCYVIRHYGAEGLSLLIYRVPKDDQIVTLFGDWNGNNIDINSETRLGHIAKQFINNHLLKYMQMMHSIRVEQAQLFFAIDSMHQPYLVDMQVSLNKLASPGMIRDVFGASFETQEVLKVELIDDRAVEYITKGSGSYEGDLIIKPSIFRMYHDEQSNEFMPLYVAIRR